MEVGIERLTALAFIVVGLSHISAPHAWVRFFEIIQSQGEAGGLLNGYVHIPLGLLILAFHPVLSWPGVLVTLIGVVLTVKGLICFLWPRLALKSVSRVTEERAGEFRIAGLVALALGLGTGWIALVNGGQV